MEYYLVQMKDDNDHSLEEVYDDQDVIISPKIRKLLKSYLDFLFENDPEKESAKNKYKRFFYYGDPDIPWWGFDLGKINAQRLMNVLCPFCGTIIQNGRILPVKAPRQFEYLLDRHRPYDSLTAFQEDVSPLEKYFNKQGINLSLSPCDTFSPLTWENPLYWHKDRIFGFISTSYHKGLCFILDRKGTAYVRNNINLYGINVEPIAVRSIFCDNIDKEFFLFSSSYSFFDSIANYKERGYVERYCEEGKHWYWEPDKQATIQCNIKFSSYRKKRELPIRFIPEARFFNCPIYPQGVIVDEELLDVLHSIYPNTFQPQKLNVVL